MIKEVDGLDSLAKRLAAMTTAAENLTPAWREIVKVLERMVDVNFTTEGSFSRAPWPPLSPRYAEWKARHYPGRRMLRRTDELYESLVRRGKGHVEIITPTALVWGTRVPYAIYHQRGTGAARTRGRKMVQLKNTPRMGRKVYERAGQFRSGMPPRPPIPNLTRPDGEAIVDIMTAHILKAGAKG